MTCIGLCWAEAAAGRRETSPAQTRVRMDRVGNWRRTRTDAGKAVLGRGSIGDLGERKAAAVCHRTSCRSCGKTFDYLAEKVVAVGAGEGAQVLAVPAAAAVVSAAARPGSGGTSSANPGRGRTGSDSRVRPLRLRTRCGVERYQPPVRRSSMSPMLQTNVPGTGGASIQPVRGGDLQAAAVVLGEQGQQPVVGVLADAPAAETRRGRRVAEDPEQDGRVRGVPVGEVPSVQAQAQRDPGQHGLAQAGQRVQVGQDQRPAAAALAAGTGWGRAAEGPPAPAGRRRAVRRRSTALPSGPAGLR